MNLHPSIRILALVMLAVAVQTLHTLPYLAIAMIMMCLLLALVGTRVYLTMLRRMRWLFITMLLVYAFTTPGEYWADWPFWIAPTYEGVHTGAAQALRLALMLGGLALLLSMTSRDALILGFFKLLLPLRFIGFDTERFAARLWLTLHYVEQPEATSTPLAMFERLKAFQLEEMQQPAMTIHIEEPAWHWRDWLALAMMLVLAVGLS